MTESIQTFQGSHGTFQLLTATLVDNVFHCVPEGSIWIPDSDTYLQL